MDKKGIAKTLATLSVLGLLAGVTVTAAGCAGTSSCSSCTASLDNGQTLAQAPAGPGAIDLDSAAQ